MLAEQNDPPETCHRRVPPTGLLCQKTLLAWLSVSKNVWVTEICLVLNEWVYSGSERNVKSAKCDKDFKRLNKLATKLKATTSNEQYKLR